jgi:16S rRNA (adenine1518-N6/adenine1519-N6)-dimethyltransferase
MPDEWLDVVDEHDNVVDCRPRQEIHRLGLLHRGVHVFLFDRHGALLVQRRQRNLVSSPLALDCSVSEHLRSGEGYSQAAVRGLQEELGLSGVGLRPVLRFSMEYGPGDNMISCLYKGDVHPKEVHPDPDEVGEVSYHALKDLLQMVQEESDTFSRWFRELLLWYCGEASDVRVIALNSGAETNPGTLR